MITLDEDTYEMPNIEYSSIIVMSSQNLLQKVKIMALFTNSIEFVANKDGLYLQYDSQKMVNQKIFFKQSSNESSEESDTSEDIKGIKYSEFKKEVSLAFEKASVLWFPTGGGKTEAYLGLVATSLLFDRLRGKTRGINT